MKTQKLQALTQFARSVNPTLHRSVVLALVALFPILLQYSAKAATNTATLFSTSATDMSGSSNYTPNITVTAATKSDIEFSNSTYGNTIFTANGAALNFGTLNDLDATQNLTITNGTATAASITITTPSNGVSSGFTSGTATDLLYVASGANLTLQNGAGTLTLDVAATGNINNAGTLNLAGPVNITAGKTVTFSGTGATTVSGTIANTTGLVTISGSNGGTVTFSGTNAYSGLTTVTSGTLTITGGNSSNGATLDQGTLILAGASDGGLASGTLTLKGGTVQAQNQAATLTNNVNIQSSPTFTGAQNITLSGTVFGTDAISYTWTNKLAGGAIVTLSGPMYLNNLSSGGYVTILSGSGNTTFNGNIADSSAVGGTGSGLNINCSGTTTISGSNTYSGMTTAGGGVVIITGTNSSNGATTDTGTLVLGGATNGGLASGTFTLSKNLSAQTQAANLTNNIVLGGALITISGSESISSSGSVVGWSSTTATSNYSLINNISNGGSLAFSGPVYLTGSNSNSVATIYGTGNTTISGNISDSSGAGAGNGITLGYLTNLTGTTTLSGSNSYTGATTIASNATLVLSGTLNGTSGITLTTATSVFTETNTGAITTGSLTVTNGSASLAGQNTYAGATNVKAGALVVSGLLSGSTTVGNAVGLTVSAVLAGSGTVGAVTVGAAAGNTGASLNPSNSVAESVGAGTTLHTGTLTLGKSSTLALQIGRTTPGASLAGDSSDRISVNGGVSLDNTGNLHITLQSGYTPAVNDILYLIINGNAPTGAFATVNGTAITAGTFSFDGGMWAITYAANSAGGSFSGGNDIAIEETVPEPGTCATLVGGLAMLLGAQRLRRR